MRSEVQTPVDPWTDRIDAVLPQTQCRQCGFDGCRPYAAAIADGSAAIDRCPPGGVAGVVALARVTGLPLRPLDSTRGITKPLEVAVVDESLCIGCTLCIQACPVDAIIGGAKRMHVVVAELCTGCELCVPPCPVDCIAMVDAGYAWDDAHAAQARTRHRRRGRRLARVAADVDVTRAAEVAEAVDVERVAPSMSLATSRKETIVAAAVARARALAEARRKP